MSMKLAMTILVLSCLGLLSWMGPVLAQTTWYVDASAPGPGSGSQNSPFTSIQDGIDAAANGDTVLVLPGTYVEVLVIAKCVDVLSTGGASVTIIDGNQYGSVVTFYNTPSPGGRLEGLTLTNGRGVNGPDGPHTTSAFPGQISCAATEGLGGAAGGINCGFASPSIRDCIITGNTGGQGGNGGTCTAWGNGLWITPAQGGSGGPGGVLFFESAARLENCFIVANTGGDGGMGSSGENSWNITYYGSGGDGGAGGVQALSSGPPPTIVGGVIANNQAGTGGDAGQSSCSLCQSSAAGGRGGIGGCDIGIGQVASSTVAANSGGAGGLGSPPPPSGGTGGPPGPMGGGGVFGGTIVNTIAWSNTPDDVSSPTSVSYSNLGVPVAGSGNISASPQFVDPTNGDFHIHATSPCVDAGDSTAPNLPLIDIDGDPRIFHGLVDIGADETILALVLSQAGAGQPVSIEDHNLTASNEYYNIFSLDLCPGDPGTGPHLGLCLTTQSNALFILDQLKAPLGTPLFHFIAQQSHTIWGPYQIPPMTVDGIVFDFTGGMIGAVSPVTRIVVQ